MLSKLLRVSRESREAALRFYRVHVPCRFTLGAPGECCELVPGLFYFNPSYDFLHVQAGWLAKHTVIDVFFYDLKNTYDPRGVGLLNLALDLIDLHRSNFHETRHSDLDSRVRMAFVETLTQLHEVFLRLQATRWASDPRSAKRVTNFRNDIKSLVPNCGDGTDF